MRIFLFLLISALFYSGGEYFSKKWADTGSGYSLILLFAAYTMGVVFWLPALKETKTLAVTGMLWLLFATTGAIILGVGVFGERMNTCQWIGAVLAITACVLLSVK